MTSFEEKCLSPFCSSSANSSSTNSSSTNSSSTNGTTTTTTTTTTRLKCCGACHVVQFCSRKCQKELWKAHKGLCKSLQQTSADSNKNKNSSPSPPSSSCLILVGMGPLGSDDINTRPIQEALLAQNLTSTVIHVNKGKYMPDQIAAVLLKKKELTVCIILGWGSGDDGLGDEFGATTGAFRDAIVQWVTSGGRLIVNGERIAHAAGDWPKWFGLGWASNDYYRTTHVRNPNHWAMEWFQAAAATTAAAAAAADVSSTSTSTKVSLEMDVKSCMIKNVEPHDILFGTTGDSVSYSPVPGFGGHAITAGQAAFAVAKYGEGTVSFFGDVNAESSTMTTIGIISRGEP